LMSKETVHVWQGRRSMFTFFCVGESMERATQLTLQLRGRFVERVGRKLRKQSFRKVIIYFLACCLVLNTSLPTVMAEVVLQPSGVIRGTIEVDPLNGGTTQNMTASDGAIGHFSDFDIASGHFVNCDQPSASASALFRVISGENTNILGTFNADGNIYLINPAGILFGDESQINVNRLVASGLDMSNDAFDAVLADAAATMVFTKYDGISGNVDVENGAVISAAESAYLIGHKVTNNGSILCPGGLVVMAAGDAVRLGQPGSNVIVTLADLTADAENVVDNSGTVGNSEAPVDKLVLAAGDVWSTAISNVKKVKIASVEDPDLDDISASAAASSDAVAEVDIEVAGDLIVDSYQIGAEAVGDGKYNATATTTINAGGDVIVTGEEGTGCVYAWAHDGSANTAEVEINAGGNVEAIAQNDGEVYIDSDAVDGLSNTADIEITAGGDVTVDAQNGSYSEIIAYTSGADDFNKANINITAGRAVEVKAIDGSIANITSVTKYADKSNTSDVEVNAKEIMVSAEGGGEVGTRSFSRIISEAFSAYDEENSENTANVAVYTHATNEEGGDVLIKATMGSEASIESDTKNAKSNTSDVLVCADGNVRVEGMTGFADILADSVDAYSNNSSNTAKVRVGARGDVGVELISEDGRARIESYAGNGYANTAETIVCAEGGVQVVDKASYGDDTAGIIAMALDGYISDAYVGICAQDDIMVMAGIGPEDFEGEEIKGVGGHAIIRAEAWSITEGYEAEEPPTATAEVAVISHNGGVAVIDAPEAENTDGPQSQAAIISSAYGGETNTAYTGVAAGGDFLDAEDPLYELTEGTGVIVLGIGDFSHAVIASETIGDYTNTSNTVVCTPSEVVVETEDAFGVAEIGASAIGDGFNTATTQVYAGDVYVYNSNLYGEGGIWANAQGWPVVPFLDDQVFILSEYDGDYGYHDLVWVEGGGVEDDDVATLLIRDYSNRQDCPECPICPCEEPVTPEPEPKRPFVPAAPIPERLSFEISGYPALTSWVAKELGIDSGKIQIWVADSLASARDIQPYDTLERLRAAATILQDAGGEYINALAQVIYEFASSTAPPTEEQMASIADAMKRNAGANNQYALAGKYLDALAEYVSILSDEMGFSPEEAVQIATERYVAPLAGSDNTAVAAYVAARLAAMGG